LKTIAAMSIAREREALVPILERAGVPAGGVLVVHSAIARLSRQGFRAEAMIETFLDHMRGGTVVMPTMTWRSVSLAQPHWDEIATRSETGVMTELFRTRYASHRSIHPTHSAAAAGAAASVLVSRHHLGDTPVSANSPYGLMRSHDAHVLMIGVGLECCTAIHLPEELIAPDIYLRPLDPVEIYLCTDRHGRVHRMPMRRHWRLDRDFPQFGPLLAAKGRFHAGDIGGCPYAVVGLRDLLESVTVALRADENGTLKQSLHTS
jgi:aminoglycoside 3-N-acetyltransferase